MILRDDDKIFMMESTLISLTLTLTLISLTLTLISLNSYDTVSSFHGSSCANNGKGALNTPEGT